MKKIFTIIAILFIAKPYSQNLISKISKGVGIIYFEDKTTPGYGSLGTGTLIIRYSNPTTAKIFLVTNKHVLPTIKQNHNIIFKLRNDSLPNSKFLDIPLQIYKEDGNLTSDTKYDPDSNDLAVINLTNYFLNFPQHQHLIQNVLLYNWLADRDTIIKNQIDVGNEILFIGYPSLLYDNRNASPIVRTGIISTVPYTDFYFSDLYRSNYYLKQKEMLPQKLNGFLIDANAAGGSSGSLVITPPKFIRVNNKGEMETFQNPDGQIFILGILTESYFDIDPKLTGMQRLNIGGVISASQIMKTIQLFNLTPK